MSGLKIRGFGALNNRKRGLSERAAGGTGHLFATGRHGTSTQIWLITVNLGDLEVEMVDTLRGLTFA